MHHTGLSCWTEERNQEVSNAILFRGSSDKSSKRDGLDKAVHRIEQALKKSRTQSTQSEEDQKTFRLRNLLNEAQGILLRPHVHEQTPSLQYGQPSQVQQEIPAINNQSRHSLPQIQNHMADENYSVDDAENPLQLLARASDLSIPQQQQPYAPNPVTHAQRQDFGQDLQTFFGPFRPILDIGEDIDPIDMGLVTLEETDLLFT